jgi:hypothetical protein
MSGIADLNGLLWEWTGGVRINNGEIQTIPYGNSMKLDCDVSASSTLWKAIMPDGTLVEPGTAGTLKVNGMKISTTAGSSTASGAFKSITADTGVDIPKLLVALGLFPDSGITGYGNDYYYNNPEGERLPLRGSAFVITSNSGPSALSLGNVRGDSSGGVGFRSAFCEL